LYQINTSEPTMTSLISSLKTRNDEMVRVQPAPSSDSTGNLADFTKQCYPGS